MEIVNSEKQGETEGALVLAEKKKTFKWFGWGEPLERAIQPFK